MSDIGFKWAAAAFVCLLVTIVATLQAAVAGDWWWAALGVVAIAVWACDLVSAVKLSKSIGRKW